MKQVIRTFAVLLLAEYTAVAQVGQPFVPACEAFPAGPSWVKHSIDKYCGPEGKASTEGSRAQNRAKNNFGASGTPIDLTIADLVALQTKVDAEGDFVYGEGVVLDPDRSSLRNLISLDGATIGEGTLVRLAGYVSYPHYAGSEGVNCKLKAGDENYWNADLHIEIFESPDDENCDRVSVEASPHCRPASWTEAVFAKFKSQKRPVRFTGHLFFDGSHVTCFQGGDFRASNWEVHPVYQVEVCKKTSLLACLQHEDWWVSLDDWENPGDGEASDAVSLMRARRPGSPATAAAAPPANESESADVDTVVAEIEVDGLELVVVSGQGGNRARLMPSGRTVTLWRDSSGSGAASEVRIKSGRSAVIVGIVAGDSVLGVQVLGYLERP